MLFLIVHIICILGFFQGLRFVQERRLPYLPVVTFNYAVAALVAALWLFVEWPSRIPNVIIGLGSLAGFCYVVHLFIMMICIRRCGVGLSATVASISAVSPVLYHYICYAAPLSMLQACALLLTPLVMYLCREPDQGQRHDKKANFFLIANFVCASCISIIHSVVEAIVPDSQALYTCCLFVAAGLAAVLVLLCSSARSMVMPHVGSLICHSFWIGLVNIAATAFVLLSLRSLPAIAVFPVAACSIIIGSAALSYWIWSEQLIQRQYLGMIGAAFVIVLIHC